MTDSQFANLHSTHDKIIGNCNFTETDFVCPGKLIPTSAVESNIDIDMDHGIDANKNDSGRSMQNRCPRRNFQTIQNNSGNIHGAAGGFTTYHDFLDSPQGKDNSDICDSETLQWQELHAIWPKLTTDNWTKINTSHAKLYVVISSWCNLMKWEINTA